MFNYVNFHNLILASQMQFSFVLMHILNNRWCRWECICVLRCFSCKIYTGNPVIM